MHPSFPNQLGCPNNSVQLGFRVLFPPQPTPMVPIPDHLASLCLLTLTWLLLPVGAQPRLITSTAGLLLFFNNHGHLASQAVSQVVEGQAT